MIEVKVICPCGTKFKFDTDPVDGRMAAPVICPRCNENQTELANQDIATKLAAAAAAAPPAVTPVTPAVPKHGPVRVGSSPSAPKPAPVLPPAKPVSPAPPSPPPVPSAGAAPATPSPPPSAKPGLQVGNKAPVAKADQTGTTPVPPPVPAGAAAVAKADDGGKGKAKPGAGSKKPSFALACLGAILGALVGTAVWVAVLYFAGIRSGYIALLVGVTAGFGAKLLGRGTSVGFGVIAAVFALFGIVGGNVLALGARVADAVSEGAAEAYEERVAMAKAVIAAKNDDEIKKAAVKELAADRSDPKTISDADLQKFKAEEMPRLKALAEGKAIRSAIESELAVQIATNLDYGAIFARMFSIGAVISWLIALGAAFRIASK